MSKLTAVQVRNAKPKERPYKLPDGQGMYLHVAPSGLKTWRYRFRVDGNESTFTLGEYPNLTLEQARQARMKAREHVKGGENPAQLRKQKRLEKRKLQLEELHSSQNTFQAIALEWIGIQSGRWTDAHSKAVLNTLQADAFPHIGDSPIDSITPPMVLEIIRGIEKRGALEIASKVLQRMNAVFRYAIQTGKAGYNPAADMKGVLRPKKVTHMPAVQREDLPGFLRALRYGDIHMTTKLALEFLILTSARSSEVRGASWSEINLEEALWRIPAERMKMGTSHTVPLSRQAVDLLLTTSKLYGQSGIIFPGIRQGSLQLSENTMLYALYRLGYHSKATVHGFRATFSTIANEAGFNPDVIEKALAHEERNRVRAAYHRSEYIEQRRELMQWWADLLQELEHNIVTKTVAN